MSSSEEFRTFVFLDLEATGLLHYDLSPGKTRIMELCFVSIQRIHLMAADSVKNEYLPRVLNKLSLCINPRKLISDVASEMTGLDNFSLEHEPGFDENAAQIIKHFFNRLPQPICLIAHNGFKFDFPLLWREIFKYGDIIPKGTKCADSLIAFSELQTLNECSPHSSSFKKRRILFENNSKTSAPSNKNAESGDRSPCTVKYFSQSQLNSDITNTSLDNQSTQTVLTVHDKHQDIPISTAYETVPQNQLQEDESVVKLTSTDSNKSCDMVKIGEIMDILSDTAALERMREINEVTPPVRSVPYNPNTETPKSRIQRFSRFRLIDIHRRMFQSDIQNSHRAESDVLALIKCCVRTGDPIFRWFDSNNKDFELVKFS